MSCKRFSDAITGHACGAPIAADAARHLRNCEACRRTFDEHRRLLADAEGVLRSELSVAASPDFVARVSAQTRELGASTKRWTLPAAWWLGAAAAAAIVIGVYVSAPVEEPAPQTLSRIAAPSVHLPSEIASHEATSSAAGALGPRTPSTGSPRELTTKTLARGERSLATRLPPVIVPPDQRQAIARLTELLRSGALDEIGVPPPAQTADLFVEPLSIPEITVHDLPSAGEPPGSGGTD
jgi:hypothetical protein